MATGIVLLHLLNLMQLGFILSITLAELDILLLQLFDVSLHLGIQCLYVCLMLFMKVRKRLLIFGLYLGVDSFLDLVLDLLELLLIVILHLLSLVIDLLLELSPHLVFFLL